MPDFDSNVKKNVDKWITALVKKTALTNDMPEKDREKANKYASLCTALLELKNVTEMQYSNRGSLKRMNDNSYRTLNDAYEKVGRLCEEYFSTPDVSNSQETYNLMQEMSAELAEDMNSLQQYNNLKTIGGKKEAVSFQTLIDRGHPQEIAIDDAKVTRLGANLSSRAAFHYKTLDGRDLNGVFTAKTTFGPITYEKDAKKNYDSHFKEVMTLFQDAYEAYKLANPENKSLGDFYGYYKNTDGVKNTSEKESHFKDDLKKYYSANKDDQKLALLKKYSGHDDVFSDVFECFRKKSTDLVESFGTLIKEYPDWNDNLKQFEEKRELIKLIFENAYSAYLDRHGSKGNVYQDRAIFYQTVCNDKDLSRGMSPADLTRMVVKYLAKKPETKGQADNLQKMESQLDPEYGILMKRFKRHCLSLGNPTGINGHRLGCTEGTRIDSRNTGMSIVADMLGRPELIAHSQPLKLKLKGKTYEGTFMDLGNGTDLARLKGNTAISNYNQQTFQTNGLRSVSDLMVIDFICGNIDRHGGNMVYQFDTKGSAKNHRFLGVQGIDNDASFGDFDLNSQLFDPIMQFPYISRMKVISKSMADKVIALDENTLKFRLRGQGLTEKQLQAAGSRLKVLQNKIKEDINFFNKPEELKEIKKDPSYVKFGHIRIVPDNEFSKLNVGTLSENDRIRTDSYFKVIRDFAQEIDPETDYVKAKLEPQVANAAEEDFGDYGDHIHISPEYAEKVAEQLKEMDMVTKPNKTSIEFESLRTAVRTYSDFCNEHTGTIMIKEDCEKRVNLLGNITFAANAYLNHKKNCFWNTDYAQKRIDLVTEMNNQYTKGDLKATAAQYGSESPELQEKLKEYKDRRIELLDCRREEQNPGFRIDGDALLAKGRRKAHEEDGKNKDLIKGQNVLQ